MAQTILKAQIHKIPIKPPFCVLGKKNPKSFFTCPKSNLLLGIFFPSILASNVTKQLVNKTNTLIPIREGKMASFSIQLCFSFICVLSSASKQRSFWVYFPATYFILKINIFLALATKLLLNFVTALHFPRVRYLMTANRVKREDKAKTVNNSGKKIQFSIAFIGK